jgi:hypothetical protein
MSNILNEGFDYHDLVNQIIPEITIDEYAAKMGDDDEIVTLAFTVKGNQVGEDLVDWFERGYDWVLDAQVSDGEISSGKYLVFVEMDRRTTVPERICELVSDMQTLTDLPIKEWTINYEDNQYDCDPGQLKSVMILSPAEYRKLKQTDLNEMRNLSGMTQKKIYSQPDSMLKDFIAKAGL